MDNAVKPGYQTTEFWLTVITNLVPIIELFHKPLNVSVNTEQAIASGIASSIVTGMYVISRFVLKHKAAA